MRLLRDNTGSARRQATALALLCLVAHLFFISATHHHQTKRLSAVSIFTNDDKDSSGSQDANSDSNCLSCRAARVFVSAVPSPAILLELIPRTISGQPCQLLPRLFNPDCIPSSRAPPAR